MYLFYWVTTVCTQTFQKGDWNYDLYTNAAAGLAGGEQIFVAARARKSVGQHHGINRHPDVCVHSGGFGAAAGDVMLNKQSIEDISVFGRRLQAVAERRPTDMWR